MKKYLLFLFLIISFTHNAQTSFDLRYSNENILKNGVTPGIDSENNYFISYLTEILTPNRVIRGSILKLSESGELMYTYDLPQMSGVQSVFAKNTLMIDDTLFYAGSHFIEDTVQSINIHSFFIMKFNNDLNVIDSLSFMFPDTLSMGLIVSVDYINDKIITVATCSRDNNNGLYPQFSGVLIVSIDKDFQNLSYAYHEDSNEFVYPFDLTTNADNNLVIACIDWKYNLDLDYSLLSQFGIFDNNLNPISSSEMNAYNSWPYHDIERYQDSLFLVASSHHIFNNVYTYNTNEDLAIYKLDRNFQMIDSVIFTHPYSIDTLEYTCSDCLDIYNNSIYFGSNKNIEFSAFWPSEPSWIRLVKLDDNLNVIWQKFYGGERANRLKGIKATPDGGCIMLCDYYDYEAYPDEFKTDLRIIKVDSNGLVTGIPEEGGLVIKSLLLYPNPSSGHVSIETALRDYSIQFFDGGGRLVWTSSKLSGNQEMDLSHLANGIYLYTVVDDDGRKLDDGKLVMER